MNKKRLFNFKRCYPNSYALVMEFNFPIDKDLVQCLFVAIPGLVINGDDAVSHPLVYSGYINDFTFQFEFGNSLFDIRLAIDLMTEEIKNYYFELNLEIDCVYQPPS